MDQPFIKIRQRFPRPRVENLERELRKELAAAEVAIAPGRRIAVAVGSRGIANLAEIVRLTVGWVRGQGGEPFVVPAMGSHGGATADGQRAVLAAYGVTEATAGAPVCASMDVVELPRDGLELAVYCDRLAAEADGTIVINRIKPHTSFHGKYESGLMKMLAIGLGKHRQALALHRRGVAGLRELMPQVALRVLRHGNVRLGIGIVENAYDETMLVKALPAARIPEEEPLLLDLARANMPSLPVDDLDILIVDEIGKNISGLGMDTNIIGRLKIPGQPEPDRPRIKLIIVRGLTLETRGNAAGIGLADIITRKAYEQIDLPATYANVLTTGFLERGKIPLIADDDRQALAIALDALALDDPAQARIVRIRNTLHIDELLISPALVPKLSGRSEIEVLGEADTFG
jgi:hypothetical protein